MTAHTSDSRLLLAELTERLGARLTRLWALVRPRTERPGGPSQHPGRGLAPVEVERHHAQSLALAGRLATGLVHDFNNSLLVAVACLTEIAEAPHDIEVVKGQSQAATEALRRASDLARKVTTLGRPDDNTREQVDLSQVVRASARLAEPLTRPCIQLSVCCPAHSLPVRVNAAQIERAILNLCLNARDAMPDGGTLHVTASSAIRWIARDEGSRRRAPVTYAVIEVSDTGRGIPRALQSQVFEPFFTTKGPDQGTGLGLATVHETALAHGGLVELTSDALGTTVRMLLPLC
jgi:two-component system cell cycle sensor histidine kinase/response regulator CckA